MSPRARGMGKATLPGLRGALCGAGRGACGRAARRSAARGRRRGAHRRARDAAGRGDPGEVRRARRHRGFPARVFALHPRGPRPDGAGRGAAARAGFGDRRPADRGQAVGRRLDPPRGEVERAAGLGVGLGARHFGAHHPAGRDAGEHPRKPRQAAWACPRCAPRRGRRCGCSARISCSGRASRRRCRAPRDSREFRYSYDMLGEGARTEADAERYFQSYARAIDAIGATAGNARLPDRPGISVKLSALHPRYEAVSRERRSARTDAARARARAAGQTHDLNFTVDAEEADRLELSLDVIGAVLGDPSLAGWDGFGLAIQAYQKRAGAVIDWVRDAAVALDRRMMVRLVKGAYWDTEVKRAQERGLAGLSGVHPQGDDGSLLHGLRAQTARRAAASLPAVRHAQCAHRRERDRAGGRRYGLRIPAPARHGRGAVRGADRRGVRRACRVYAPVGGHRDLLAYLVRRLLENGANSSFVSVAADPSVPVAKSCSGRRTGSRTRATRGIRAFRCRATSTRRRAGIPPAWSSATARASRLAG